MTRGRRVGEAGRRTVGGGAGESYSRLVVTSGLTSVEVSLTSDVRSPDEVDEASGSITRLRFVWFTSNFVHLTSLHF